MVGQQQEHPSAGVQPGCLGLGRRLLGEQFLFGLLHGSLVGLAQLVVAQAVPGERRVHHDHVHLVARLAEAPRGLFVLAELCLTVLCAAPARVELQLSPARQQVEAAEMDRLVGCTAELRGEQPHLAEAHVGRCEPEAGRGQVDRCGVDVETPDRVLDHFRETKLPIVGVGVQ